MVVVPGFIQPAEKPDEHEFNAALDVLEQQFNAAMDELDRAMNGAPVAATGWIGIPNDATVDWGSASDVTTDRYVGIDNTTAVANIAWQVVQPDDNNNPNAALQKVVTAINTIMGTKVTAVYEAPQPGQSYGRINLTAAKTGTQGNSIAMQISSAFSFLETSGATLTGGKEGNVRQMLEGIDGATNFVFTAGDRLLIQGQTDHKEALKEIGRYAPTESPTETERRLTEAGFPIYCGKPIVRDNVPRFSNVFDLVNYIGPETALDEINKHAPGSLIIVPTKNQTKAVPYFTSCGTVYRDEVQETVLALDSGPLALGTDVDYKVFHLGQLQPTPSMVDRLVKAGFTDEQVGFMMNWQGDSASTAIPLGTSSTDKSTLKIQRIDMDSITALNDATKCASYDDIKEMAYRKLTDWIPCSSPRQWQAAVQEFFNKALGASFTANATKALEMINQGEIWPFGDYLRNALDQVGQCVDDKLRKILEWLTAKIERFNEWVQNNLVGPVMKFVNSAQAFIEFIKGIFQNFPGSLLLCLIGDFRVSLLRGLDTLLTGVMLAINTFIDMVTRALTPLFFALQIAQTPICICGGMIEGLLGRSIPGLQCLPPLNITIPEVFKDFLGILSEFLGMVPQLLNTIAGALAQILNALAGLFNFSLSSTGPGQCSSASIMSMLIALAALVGATAAAGLAKALGVCQPPSDSSTVEEPQPTAEGPYLPSAFGITKGGRPKGWCPSGSNT